MLVRHCLPLLLIFSSIGCVAIQDCEYRFAQSFRTETAWWIGIGDHLTPNPISHYSFGWRRGYRDVLLGGDGNCPPVPPQKYWSHKYQSEDGECFIEEWYQGYRDGGEAAQACCCNQYQGIPMSNVFRGCECDCLDGDQSHYRVGRTHLGFTNRLTRSQPRPISSSVEPDDEPESPSNENDGDDEMETPQIPPRPTGYINRGITPTSATSSDASDKRASSSSDRSSNRSNTRQSNEKTTTSPRSQTFNDSIRNLFYRSPSSR